MKRFSIFAFAAVAMLFVGCTKDIDTDIVKENGIVRGELVTKTVVMEDTRVERDDVTGNLKWNEGDKVNAVLLNNGKYTLDTKTYAVTFVNGKAQIEIPSNTAYMVYPAGSIIAVTDAGVADMNFWQTLTVTTNTDEVFKRNPMKGTVDGDFVTFKNLMGYLKVPVTGDGILNKLTVKSEIFNGFKPISRKMKYDLTKQNATFTLFNEKNEASSWLNIAFSDGIQLSTNPEIYIPVPENTYTNLALVAETDNGSVTVYANNSHKVTRSKIKPVSSSPINITSHIATDPTLLSGTSGMPHKDYANTYIVPPTAGEYAFEANLCDGTALTGGVTAEIVWAEEAGMFYDFSYNPSDNTISFKTNGKKGNALIALSKNNADSKAIVWTWLLWCTDTPDVIKMNSSNYYVMDRVLGATWAPSATLADQRSALGTSENWPINASVSATDATDACGLYYQYQNMIPYPRVKDINAADESQENLHNTRVGVQYGFSRYGQYWTASSSCGEIEIDENGQPRTKASLFPNYMYYFNSTSNNAGWTFSSLISRNNTVPEGEYRLWGGVSATNPDIAANKTNQDPCPMGYIIDTYGTIYWGIEKKTNINDMIGFVRNPQGNASFKAGYRVYAMYMHGCQNSAGQSADLYFPCASNRAKTTVTFSGDYGNMGYIYTFNTDANGEKYATTYKFGGTDEEPQNVKVYYGSNIQYGGCNAGLLNKPTINAKKTVNAQGYNVRCLKGKE